MADLTDVKGLFGLVTFKIGVVFDVFSRMPLSVRVFEKEPSSLEIARFVGRAAKRYGRPKHFVSDRGPCFIGRVFRRALRLLGVKPRYGAIGRKGSIALIERLWRTLKDTLGLTAVAAGEGGGDDDRPRRFDRDRGPRPGGFRGGRPGGGGFRPR